MARDEIGPVGGAAALIAVLVDHDHPAGGARAGGGQRARRTRRGACSRIAMTIPIAFFMGFYLRVAAAGAGRWRSPRSASRCCCSPSSRGGWVAESSWPPVFTLDKVTLVWCLIVYGFLASVLPVWMLLAPARLPVDLHEGRHDRPAGGRCPHRDAGASRCPRSPSSRSHGEGPVVRGFALPVRVHHHRLWCAVGLPRADRLRHHAEDDREGDGRSGSSATARMLMESFVAIMALVAACDDRPGSVLRHELGGGRHRRHGPGRGAVRQRARLSGVSTTPEALNEAAASVQEEIAGVAHRRCADARGRDLGDPRRGLRRRGGEGVLVPLRDHVRGPVHPHHGGRGTRVGPLHAAGHPRQRGAEVRDTSWRPGVRSWPAQ